MSAHRATARTRTATLASLPPVAQARISGALGRDLPSYQVQRLAGVRASGFEARNPRQRLRADFTSGGLSVHSGQAVWRLALAGFGYDRVAREVARGVETRSVDLRLSAGTREGQDMHNRSAPPAVSPVATGNRVEYRRGALIEWYVNGPLGVEQGFTLSRLPPKDKEPSTNDQGLRTNDKGLLTISLKLSGSLKTSVRDSTGLTLSRDGHPVLRYTGLTAYDANGTELRAWLELQGQRLLLRADDAGARYPITIDPIVQLAELTASDGAASEALGSSIAISGNTVVAGAPTGSALGGAAYVFVEPATGWANMTQTAKLTTTDSQRPGELGASVAMSGNTVVVGAPLVLVDGHVDQGAAYVYVEPPGGWKDMIATAKLTAFDGEDDDFFGSAVAIDNGTVAVGAPAELVPGMAYVYVEPSGGWKTTSMYDAKLTASDGTTYDQFGGSVSMSGNTIVTGAQHTRAAYVFVRPAEGWTSMTQTAELTASGRPGGDLGISVSISGNTIVAGAPTTPLTYDLEGAVYLFVKPAAGWANMAPTATLTASNARYGASLGQSVAISGNTVLAGAIGAGPSLGGAVYVFVEPKAGWVTMTQTSEFTVAGAPENAQVGYSVALRSCAQIT
ncbi:MAG TPA: FG-GAP repeat protein [Terriglobia bacterium]